jgi:hypothetical protein
MPRASERGRHRLLTAEQTLGVERQARRRVPVDVQAALQRAVEDTGETFDQNDWSYVRNSIMGWVANRKAPSESPYRRLAISDECFAAWVGPGDDVEDRLAELAKSDPLGRGTIEFLLSDEAPFYKGHWFLVPVEGMGWICSRERRFRREQRFLVSFNHKYVKTSATTAEEARPALERLLAEPNDYR